MKISLISGSHRVDSQTAKVARFLEATLRARHPGVETWLLDLATARLPLWDPGVWDGAVPWPELWNPIASELQNSDAVVVLTPEWGGMVTPGIKNFLLLCSNAELAHKPGLLVGVSAGRGGAYPIAELRMSGYKNNRVCWIPDHLIVRRVGRMLNGPEGPTADGDEALRVRIAYALDMLMLYADALGSVRRATTVDHETFPNGM